MGAALFSPIFAIFIKDFIVGATLKTMGFAVAIYALTKAIFQIPLAKKIDKYDGERDDFFALAAGAVIGIIFPFSMLAINHVWQLYLFEALAGIGDASLMAAYYGIFAKHTDKGSESFEWSLFSALGITVSTAIGGAFGGLIADNLGFRFLFLISGILNLLAGTLFFLLYPYIRKKKQNTEIPIIIPVEIKK